MTPNSINFTYQSASKSSVMAAFCEKLAQDGWKLEKLNESYLEAQNEAETILQTKNISINFFEDEGEINVDEDWVVIANELLQQVLEYANALDDETALSILSSYQKQFMKPELVEQELESEQDSFQYQPFKNHLVTTLLIIATLLVFLAMIISGVNFMQPETQDIVVWGGNLRGLVQGGAYWRLFSNFFVHIGVLHLVLNMYALFYIGRILEQIIGTIRFTIAYVVCGLLASVCSLWWHMDVVSAGASGAVFGMYGMFLSMLLFKAVDAKVVDGFLSSIVVFVGYSLLSGVKDGIDNAAHIGGLVSGFALGLGMVKRAGVADQKRTNTNLMYVIGMVLLVVGFGIYQTVPKSNTLFADAFEKLTQFEQNALSIDTFSDKISDEEMITLIHDVGIPSWESGRKMMVEIDESKLSPREQKMRNLMITYCELRKRSYELYGFNLVNTNVDSIQQFDELNERLKNLLDNIEP